MEREDTGRSEFGEREIVFIKIDKSRNGNSGNAWINKAPIESELERETYRQAWRTQLN